MHEKLEIYDILGVLVPGVLIVCAIPLAFPSISQDIANAKIPGTFAVIGLTAASIFAGYLAQALASLIEPVLNWTFGGRLSERALSDGLGKRYFEKADGERIRGKLVSLATPDAPNQSLFYIAMQIAETCESGRAPRFNALYPYHRTLVLFVLLAIAFFTWSFWGGLASHLTHRQDCAVGTVLVLLLALFWNRTKQRGIYYVREVLFCAEREITKSTKEGQK